MIRGIKAVRKFHEFIYLYVKNDFLQSKETPKFIGIAPLKIVLLPLLAVAVVHLQLYLYISMMIMKISLSIINDFKRFQ